MVSAAFVPVRDRTRYRVIKKEEAHSALQVVGAGRAPSRQPMKLSGIGTFPGFAHTHRQCHGESERDHTKTVAGRVIATES